MTVTNDDPSGTLRFRLGTVGALLPLGVFLAGVTWLGLSGAPDERGFWPILVAALLAGVALARDRAEYCEAVVDGMRQRVVMLMVLAWLLAGILGAVLGAAGLVEALVGVAAAAGVSGGGFVVACFLITCVFSAATGTSLGTLVVCAPLLYPGGAALGADPVWLMGSLVGGATFGDNVSPVSDTTIASATSQEADLGGVVRSRLVYALPAAAVAAIGFALLGGGAVAAGAAPEARASTAALGMLVAPVAVLIALLRGRHLVEGLLGGCGVAVALALLLGRVAPGDLLVVSSEDFLASGLLLTGMQRGVGISVFTLLLMGLVGPIERSGIIERLVDRSRATDARGAEWRIFGVTSAAVILTTHSTVAILAAARFARITGRAHGVDAYRRANILDVTVCTYPFLLPWFVPTILAASLSASGVDFGMPRLSPLQAGAANLHSWMLLAIIVVAIATGWPRRGRSAS